MAKLARARQRRVRAHSRRNPSLKKASQEVRIREESEKVQSGLNIEEGDLVITGTPKGVGPVKDGDTITGEIPGIAKIDFSVSQRT